RNYREMIHIEKYRKIARNRQYSKADETTPSFASDEVPIFPQQDSFHETQFLNERLGVGNRLQASSLFLPKGRKSWKCGDSILPTPHLESNWKETDQTTLAIPMDQLKPGGNLMALVQETMMCYYNYEDRSIVDQVLVRQEEDAFDGVCTTGFCIDGIPMNQPLLQPILPEDPTDIFCRLPVVTSIEFNPNAKTGIPKYRATFQVYGEKISGFGETRAQARRDGALKLCYTFQHVLDVHDYDHVYWFPLPSKDRPKARGRAENELINAVRCKAEESTPIESEISPRLFQSEVTVQGYKIQAQAWSKKLARKRLHLYLMLLMPKELRKIDTTVWLGDGAGMAPDASYGQTDVQRGLKRSSDIELEHLVKRAKKQPLIIFDGSDDELKVLAEKHVATSFSDNYSFPINPRAKKSMSFFLQHRCQGRYKFDRIDKTVNDKLVVNLLLPDGTDHIGHGKNLDSAKHSALIAALDNNTILAQTEPMSFYGICAYGLLQATCKGIHLAVQPNHDSSVWTCTIHAGRPETNGDITIETFAASDFTKKGAQRLAACQFLSNYNNQARHIWKLARKTAVEKHRNASINYHNRLTLLFQPLGIKKPSLDDSGLITWSIYGKTFSIKGTGEKLIDDQNIFEEISTTFPFLTAILEENIENEPIKIMKQKLSMNKKLQEMGGRKMNWKIEHFDDEIKYFRVSFTLPSLDRFVGEGTSLASAQNAAALNCLKNHPVLSIGDSALDLQNHMQKLVTRVSSKGGEVKTKVESGDPDCPVTMYCRVRVSVFQNGVKLTESTATGISKIHAESRAAFKIIEEPKYEGKPCLAQLQERKIQVRWEIESAKEDLLKKVSLMYAPPEHKLQIYEGEGITENLAKAKVAKAFLTATFGPDRSFCHEREVTSIRQIKPMNRNGENDPDLPPICRERGNRLPEEPVDLNVEAQKRIEKFKTFMKKVHSKKNEALENKELESADEEEPLSIVE
ncbi:unnamed protein product, partial [Oikopleura dioica]